MKHFTSFSHTGSIEIYHFLYNKWILKSTHFSFMGMVFRSQLAAIDFNLGTELQLTGRENLCISKITNQWLNYQANKEQKIKWEIRVIA